MNDHAIFNDFILNRNLPLLAAKRLFCSEKISNVGMIETNRLALTMKGVVNRSLDDTEGLQSADYSVYQLFEKGDLVFKLIDLENIKTSRVGIVHEKGIMSPAYIRLKPVSKIVVPRYYYWYFYALYLNNIFNTLGGGIRQNLVASELLELPVPMIPSETQNAISDYLDQETARIDTLISEKKSFIDLLKEKLQALISHYVTKGIDANVPMKESGVDFIGSIPEHWKITKLGYLGKCQNGINIEGDAFGTGFPFVSYGDVYNNRILPTIVSGLVESTPTDRKKYSVIKGDVLFTRTSETAEEIGFTSVCHETVHNAVFAGFLIRFRPYEDTILPEYSRYVFQNQKLRQFFTKEMNVVTRASLSQELLKKMPVILPSLFEQKQIADYLSRKEEAYISLIEATTQSIELLKEKRTALISAAVTGKIDVHNYNKTEAV